MITILSEGGSSFQQTQDMNEIIIVGDGNKPMYRIVMNKSGDLEISSKGCSYKSTRSSDDVTVETPNRRTTVIRRTLL